MNNGNICVSVCDETAEGMLEKIAAACELADIVEVRFDCLRPEDGDLVLSAVQNGVARKPVIITFRAFDQGGTRELSPAERHRFWERVTKDPLPGSLTDIEADELFAGLGPSIKQIQRIVSHHDFSGVLADLPALFDRICTDFKADIVKIAVTANDITDTIEIWKLIEYAGKSGKKIIPIAMGEAGKWTRILGLAHGAFLTYSSLEAGVETAPGQVTAQQMAQLYRAKELDLDTKVFGILGNPVSQSLSTFMHNPAFVSMGVNGVFIPLLVKDIEGFMRRMVRPETRQVELNFGGFSVTMPHKQSIIAFLDEIEPTAAKIGAVNTVKVSDDGCLMGYNTDAYGFVTPLKKLYGDLRSARVAVVGAGGASRACVYALQDEGAVVELFVRDVNKARAVAEQFGVAARPVDDLLDLDRRGAIDILVDTTPIGMAGPAENESLFTSDQLKGIKFVYDLVTKPYDTPIIREAKAAGIPAIGGLEMLVEQGAKQFKIWTGHEAPIQKMKECVLARFAELNK